MFLKMETATQTSKSELQRHKHKKTVTVKELQQNTDVESKEKDILKVTENQVLSCEFEIFGIVQGVSFRLYTLRRAQKLGVRGWCENTNNNTVKGVIQGYPKVFETMRLWLQYTGSPTSRIDKCVFGSIEQLDDFTYTEFSIHYN